MLRRATNRGMPPHLKGASTVVSCMEKKSGPFSTISRYKSCRISCSCQKKQKCGPANEQHQRQQNPTRTNQERCSWWPGRKENEWYYRQPFELVSPPTRLAPPTGVKPLRGHKNFELSCFLRPCLRGVTTFFPGNSLLRVTTKGCCRCCCIT